MAMLMSLVAGVGLSAACGFRVFLPMLLLSAGSYSGYLRLGEDLAWLGSTPALIALGVATLVEIVGYLVPWVDHALDGLAVPMSVAAGTALTASLVADFDPLVRWSLALIAGGGTAGGVRTTLATVRAGSTATTGGLANPIVGLFEAAMSTLMTILAVLAPILAAVVLAACFYVLILILRRARRLLAGRQETFAP